MNPPAATQLVIFDLDGTVVDTLPPTLRCFQEALAPALGRTPSVDEIQERFGPPESRIFEAWVGREEAVAVLERLYSCYERSFHQMHPFPGMVGLLRKLRRMGIKTALFTGRGRDSTDVLLRSLNLDPLFDATVTGDDAVRPKPAPDGVRQILEELAVSASHAVLVGDTRLDMEAARAAGVRPVVARWGIPAGIYPEGSDLTRVENVEALGRLLLGDLA